MSSPKDAADFEAAGTLALTGVTVVDTRTGQLTPESTVTLADGRIRSIRAGGDAAQPAEGTRIDARGKFVVPGYLDMHVHSFQYPDPAPSLHMLLAYGVTGARQMAGTPEMLELRRQGRLTFGPETPELLAMPGEILTFANCPTPEAAVAEVRRQKEQGADFIKTIAVSPPAFFASLAESRRLGLPYGGHLSPGVDVAKASKAGLGFIEHLGPTEMQLIQCSRAEVFIRLMMKFSRPPKFNLTMRNASDTMQVLVANPMLIRLNMDPKTFDKTQKLVSSFSPTKAKKLAEVFRENHTWQCPTLIRVETMQFGDEPRFTESPDLRYIPNQMRQVWSEAARQYREKLTPGAKDTLNRTFDLGLRLVKMFDENGVGMIAGTDFGGGWIVPGISLHQEFDLLERAGLSPLKVLQMTTLNGAIFLNREASMGTVEEGKDANLVLLDANPVESVQNLHKVHAVVRAGRFFAKHALEQLKQRVADRMAAA